ncbi:hypothetical protein [Cupriavidus pampae]|uniref:Uncharacterized protein n=1 Tax=Cupriavidus pampae TaxID=659251 RepID=A0ABN7ZKR6_9BURK|nr:hypothetical protein [Cupriavidus pampae]CAG9185813.1 hypothetical protein LMG32289_06126 [Cupriavidus pampae]
MTAERCERGAQMLATVDGVAGPQVVESLAKSFSDFTRYVLQCPFGDIYT